MTGGIGSTVPTGTIVAVGASYLDTILSVPYYPVEDEKLRATSLHRRHGGNCPNTLAVLSQLLAAAHAQTQLALIAVLPAREAPATKSLEQEIGRVINLSQCVYREEHQEPASSFIIKSGGTGSRTIVNYNALPEMTVDEFIARAAALRHAATWYHFEGRIPEVTMACIQHLRVKFPNVTISVEVEKPGRHGLQDLAVLADVVFYSKSWGAGMGFSSAEACVLGQKNLVRTGAVLCCTWGEYGAVALDTANPAEPVHCEAFSAGESVIDTVGAGDTFIAGMLYSLIHHHSDWTLEQKLHFAVELAGRKVAQEGFDGLGQLMRI